MLYLLLIKFHLKVKYLHSERGRGSGNRKLMPEEYLLTVVLAYFPIPEKLIISGNFDFFSTHTQVRPLKYYILNSCVFWMKTNPCLKKKKFFLILNVPEVGVVTLDRTFSRVDLPAPLALIKPTVFPIGIFKSTFLRAQ